MYGATVSSAPTSLPSTLKRTPATPPESVAFAVSVPLATTVEPSAGLVTATAGGVVSGGRVVKLQLCGVPSVTPLAALIVAASRSV